MESIYQSYAFLRFPYHRLNSSAEGLMKASRADTSTLGRSTFFRRKLKERRTKSLTKNAIDDVAFNEGNCDVPLPAYERVILTHPPFQRYLLSLISSLIDLRQNVSIFPRLLCNVLMDFTLLIFFFLVGVGREGVFFSKIRFGGAHFATFSASLWMNLNLPRAPNLIKTS